MMGNLKKKAAWIALLGAALMLSSACGQKPWVAEELEARLAAAGEGAYIDPNTGQTMDASGNPVTGGAGAAGGSTVAGGGSGT